LHWKVGFEIELLAPPGFSRRDLADEIARRSPGATVIPAFHPQAELSLVENAPVFENLTLAYDVISADGNLIARCADDLTLQNGLDTTAPPKPGWYRIVGDDARILRLIMQHAKPEARLDKVLMPAAKLFGTKLECFENGMVRLADSYNAPIAMAAPLPGERERPCEIITAPITNDHSARLSALLEPAGEMGFAIPQEAALHIHFDAEDLCNARVFANLVHLFSTHGQQLKYLLGTNPNCRRLGSWPDQLQQLVFQPGFDQLTWQDARDELSKVELTKYVDFNVFNMVHEPPGKHTFEVRILPVSLDVETIMLAAALFEALLGHVVAQKSSQRQATQRSLFQVIDSLTIDSSVKRHWLNNCNLKNIP